MDKLKRYRGIIKQLLSDRADLMRSQPVPGEQVVCLFEEETANYILLRFGWLKGKRLHSITLHVSLANGKIHIEQDWTEDFIENLVLAGVSSVGRRIEGGHHTCLHST